MTALKRTVKVQPGGLIEIRSDELPVGASADVIVLLAETRPPSPQPAEATAADSIQLLDSAQRTAHLTPKSADLWAAANRQERRARGGGADHPEP